MYIWNIFAVIGQSPHLLNPILERIDRHLRVEEENLGEFYLVVLFSKITF